MEAAIELEAIDEAEWERDSITPTLPDTRLQDLVREIRSRPDPDVAADVPPHRRYVRTASRPGTAPPPGARPPILVITRAPSPPPIARRPRLIGDAPTGPVTAPTTAPVSRRAPIVAALLPSVARPPSPRLATVPPRPARAIDPRPRPTVAAAPAARARSPRPTEALGPLAPGPRASAPQPERRSAPSAAQAVTVVARPVASSPPPPRPRPAPSSARASTGVARPAASSPPCQRTRHARPRRRTTHVLFAPASPPAAALPPAAPRAWSSRLRRALTAATVAVWLAVIAVVAGRAGDGDPVTPKAAAAALPGARPVPRATRRGAGSPPAPAPRARAELPTPASATADRATFPPSPAPAPPPARHATRHRRAREVPIVEHTVGAFLGAGADRKTTAAIAAARAAYLRANRRLFAGKTGAAIRYYRRALDLYPGYVASYRGLGIAHALRGDTSRALRALRTYVAKVPHARDVPLIERRIASLERGRSRPR